MRQQEALEFIEKLLGVPKEAVQRAILRSNTLMEGSSSLIHAFRFNGNLLDGLDFPRAPFAIFYIATTDFIGFHIRFEDVARGGLRTVIASLKKPVEEEAASSFFECYDLAWTQEFKNKDIPEGGSKGVIFIKNPKASLVACQQGYIRALFSLLVGLEEPEYLFLGPDERMSDEVLEWIGEYSKKIGYVLRGATITSRPSCGINHKEFGVTSSGLMVYLREGLQFIGLDASSHEFTVKITGGPDGDVAGNLLRLLALQHPKKAKLIAIRDISGLLYEPQGLDLEQLVQLFYEKKPVAEYPRKHISSGGFFESPQGIRYENFLHTVKADVFIPCGGRRKTLQESNVATFFRAEQESMGGGSLSSFLLPSSQLVIEGANLYLSQGARDVLERAGVLVIRDSSANKGGVICSSYEVFAQLTIGEEQVGVYKVQIAQEVLAKIAHLCRLEMTLLLNTHKKTGLPCSLISKQISTKILEVASKVRDELSDEEIADCVDIFALPIIKKLAPQAIVALPNSYKHAIAAKFLASRFVYFYGPDAAPPARLPLEQIIAFEKSALKTGEC